MDDLTNPQSVTNLLGLRGLIESDLRHWVIGGRVYSDGNDKPRFLKRLTKPPHEAWEIRVTEPRVHMRLFSRFAEPDTIITTKFHTRKLLGKKSSPEWAKAIKACEQCWEKLFPGIAPFTGVSIHDYVTANCDDFPI